MKRKVHHTIGSLLFTHQEKTYNIRGKFVAARKTTGQTDGVRVSALLTELNQGERGSSFT